MLRGLLRHWEANTISGRPRLELVSALIIAPLLEEAIFRVGVSRLAALLRVERGPVALASAVVFGLTHRRFGYWFMGYAWAGGLMLGATYARWGYWAAVLLHVLANLVDLSVGWRRHLLRSPCPT